MKKTNHVARFAVRTAKAVSLSAIPVFVLTPMLLGQGGLIGAPPESLRMPLFPPIQIKDLTTSITSMGYGPEIRMLMACILVRSVVIRSVAWLWLSWNSPSAHPGGGEEVQRQ